MKRIAVNTRLLLHEKLEGIGTFSDETLRRIVKDHPDWEFHFIFDRPYHPSFIYGKNVIPHVLFPPTRHPILWYVWFEWTLPPLLRKIKPDLFLSPDGWMPLSFTGKSLNVIHDLNFEHLPQFIPKHIHAYYKYFFPRFARKATRLATVSEFSKMDIVNTYKIRKDKIDVVYNGSSEGFKTLSAEEKTAIKADVSGGENYFFFIGLIHPRKNVARLIKAFDLFKEKSGNSLKLVLAGESKWWTNDIEEAYKSSKYITDIVLTGRVTKERLYKLMGAAYALTYVPIFEGFGIPILEAFNCNVPVITSNTSSIPEVTGDAALLIDPEDENSIADAMLRLFNDQELYKSLQEKADKQKELYSWELTADKLNASIYKALE